MSEAGEAYIFEGKTVEEAVAKGLRVLGLRREDVQIEVLSEGSRGILLGLGAEPARVRLVVLAPLAEPAPTERVEDVEAPAEAPVAPAVEISPPEEEELESLATELLQGLLDRMGFRATVAAYWDKEESANGEPPLVLNIQGRDLGVLIGRQAETLAALQYLVRVMVNQRLHRWTNIIVDVEGYKKRRAKSLRQLALRMADQVARTGRPVILEAMPAAERRLVHLALRDHPHVYTVSVGKEPRRKVTIRPKKE